MFFKHKARKAIKKVVNAAPRKEVKAAFSDVYREAERQLSRKIDKLSFKFPVKVKIPR